MQKLPARVAIDSIPIRCPHGGHADELRAAASFSAVYCTLCHVLLRPSVREYVQKVYGVRVLKPSEVLAEMKAQGLA